MRGAGDAGRVLDQLGDVGGRGTGEAAVSVLTGEAARDARHAGTKITVESVPTRGAILG